MDNTMYSAPMQYQQQYNNNNMQSSYNNRPKKNRALNIFQVPLFTCFNPRSATVTFIINGKTGNLGIEMAPAIPNNAAIGIKGPVPKDIKVYDYSKKVYSDFTQVDCIDFVNFLKSRYDNKNNNIMLNNIIRVLNNNIATISQKGEVYKVLCDFGLEIAQQLKNSVPPIEKFGLYRKTATETKAWNFNYDENSSMLHISVAVNNDFNNRVKISLSYDMAAKLTVAIDSYVSNMASILMQAKLNSELSKTLVANNFKAPDPKDNTID